jgi:hypothetical protein
MEGRQIRLGGVIVMIWFLSATIACYTYVIFHYAHFWTLMLNCAFLTAAFLCPAVCYGYDTGDSLHVPDHLSQERYLNMRDVGYGLALILYAQCYIIPAAAWYRSDGVAPSMGTVLVVYGGNLCCGLAFEVWARLFIWS